MSSISSPRKSRVFDKGLDVIEEDFLVLQTNNERVLQKQNEIFKIKEKMYTIRYDETMEKEEIIRNLQVSLIYQNNFSNVVHNLELWNMS